MLNHAVDAIKHFILMFEPSNAVNSLDKLNYDITMLSDNVSDMANYITKLDKLENLEEFIHECTHSNLPTTNASSDKFIKNHLLYSILLRVYLVVLISAMIIILIS